MKRDETCDVRRVTCDVRELDRPMLNAASQVNGTDGESSRLSTSHVARRTSHALFQALSVFAVLLLAACAGRNYQAPLIPAPQAWNTTQASGTVPLATWWSIFHDPALDALVLQVLAANLDVKLAEARLRESRALLGVAESGHGPTVHAGAGMNRSRVSENGVMGARGAGTGTLYQAGFDATWEIDIFGGVRRGVEAANADLAGLEESRREVLVSVSAETVRTWLDLRTAQARQTLALALVDNARAQMAIVLERQSKGLTGDDAVALAANNLSNTEAALPPLVIAATLARDRLAVLLGKSLETKPGISPNDSLPEARDIFTCVLPAEIIRQRPDLRRAERELAAATARIGVTEADLYPRFSLTGSFGVQSTDTANLATFGSSFWSIGPTLRWPILSSGRIRNQVKAADARADQAALRFEQAVLRAFAEVEDALVSLAQDRAREGHMIAACQARERLVVIQEERHRAGLSDAQVLLRSQAERLLAQDQHLLARRQALLDLAALAKALGGGWNTAE